MNQDQLIIVVIEFKLINLKLAWFIMLNIKAPFLELCLNKLDSTHQVLFNLTFAKIFISKINKKKKNRKKYTTSMVIYKL